MKITAHRTINIKIIIFSTICEFGLTSRKKNSVSFEVAIFFGGKKIKIPPSTLSMPFMVHVLILLVVLTTSEWDDS